jgi:ATP-dependent Clp protease ATP-binding subunit ClpX
MSSDDSNEVSYQCAFCEKERQEVGKLIGSPSGVFICDVCVLSCVDLIKDRNDQTSQKTLLNPITPVLPADMHDMLNEYVIGQDRAKKSAQRGSLQSL